MSLTFMVIVILIAALVVASLQWRGLSREVVPLRIAVNRLERENLTLQERLSNERMVGKSDAFGFHRIMAAVVAQEGGVYRIKKQTLESIDDMLLSRGEDTDNGDVLFRTNAKDSG